MAITYKIETQPSYLLMTYEGYYDSSVTGEFTSQIVEACEKYQPSKLLIDFRKVEGRLSTMDRFNLGGLFAVKYLAKRLSGKIPSCRFTMVGNYPLIDPRRFAETVAVNRGINVKTFTEMKDAIAWLDLEPVMDKTIEPPLGHSGSR